MRDETHVESLILISSLFLSINNLNARIDELCLVLKSSPTPQRLERRESLKLLMKRTLDLILTRSRLLHSIIMIAPHSLPKINVEQVHIVEDRYELLRLECCTKLEMPNDQTKVGGSEISLHEGLI